MKKIISFTVLFALASFLLQGQDLTTYTKVGDKAPTFKCRTLDGKEIDISSLKGKVILINFFATWCGPCNKELPVLQSEIWDKYKNNKRFELIIIGREHNETELSDWVKAKGFLMPFAADPKREIYSLFVKESIPRNYIIDKNGFIAFQNIGYEEKEFEALRNKLAVS